MKKINLLFTVVAILLFLVPSVSAVIPLTIDEVKIENFNITPNDVNSIAVERGEDLELKVKITASQNADDLEIFAFISGYEFNYRTEERLADSTPLFDVKANTSYVKTLKINLPDIVLTDTYKLRLMIANKDDSEIIQNYNVAIEPERHLLKIHDVLLSPGSTVRSGEALLVTVRLANRGQKDEDDIKVTASIPELGVSASDFVGEVEKEDDEQETEEMYLRIPSCAKEGVHELKITVEYNERRETLTQTEAINVLSDDTCGDDGKSYTPEVKNGKTFVTMGSQMETVYPDNYAVFPLTITNSGKTSKSYTFSIKAPQGLQYKMTPTSSAVVPAGESQTFHLFVNNDGTAQAGPNTIIATVNPGRENASVAMTANVVKKSSWVSTLLIIGLVLLAIIVIIMATIFIANKTGERDDLMPPSTPRSELYY